MKTFHLSIKKNNNIFRGLDKVPINLNTASNITDQARDLASSLLASMNTIYAEDDYSWKIYSFNGYEYWFVTKSKNWVGD